MLSEEDRPKAQVTLYRNSGLVNVELWFLRCASGQTDKKNKQTLSEWVKYIHADSSAWHKRKRKNNENQNKKIKID